MSPTKYAIAICDDEKYWQNQILNCCKLLDMMNQLSISEYNPRMKYCDKLEF